MGKAYETPQAGDVKSQPDWAKQLNQGAAEVGATVKTGGIPGVTTSVPSAGLIAFAKPVECDESVVRTPPVETAPITSPVPPAVAGMIEVPNSEDTPETPPCVVNLNEPLPKPEKLKCIIKDCRNKQKTRGLCGKCYAAAVQWTKACPSQGWAWLVKEGIALDSARDTNANKFAAAVELKTAKAKSAKK